MSMKLDLGKVFFFILLLVLSTMTAMAGNIKGTVLDKQTKEPLTGATIQITGTALGVVADIDGNYTLKKVKLLILDGLLYPLKEAEARDVLELVEARNKVASTIFCSQYGTSEWH